MLKIFDQHKNPLGYIVKYTDLKIESELSTGDKTLSFTYRAKKGIDIRNEYYVETKEDRYVVKEVGASSDDFPTFVCQLDLEDLEAEMLETFSAIDVTLTDAANLALAGTGWTVDTDITKKRSAAAMKVTPLSALGKIKDAWMCEMRFDTKNKAVYFREQFGEDKGVFFAKSLNLRKLDLTSDSYDYYTRIIPIGADNLRINDVNGGKSYVENYQYSDKIRTLIWEDTNYEDAEALKEDAEKKLEDMSKPVKSYSADIIDLAAQRPEYSIMSFGLGDTILLLDKETGVKEKQRIVKLTEYPQDPGKNTCELSNTTLTFEEMQDRLEAAAKAVEDITNADGTVNGYYVHGVEADGIVGIEVVINGSSAIKDINSELSSMSGAIVDINGSLSAAVARIGTLETTALTATEADLKYATIEQLNVTNQTVHSIQGDYADFKTVTTKELAAQTASIDTLTGNIADFEAMIADKLSAEEADLKYATIEELNAVNATVEGLDAIYATIEQLQAQNAIITNVQGDLANYKTVIAAELTAAKGWMLEGAIGDAQISDLSANKIKAGTVNTALVTVASADGAIEITGNQIMVNDVTDASNPVNRVIVGKYNMDSDTVEYGLLVRSEDGKTVMIDGDGVHNAGITDGAVDNNKVADDANIAGSKLDINSVVTEINGATEKISSTIVQVGNKTLQVYLGEQENILDEYGETLISQAAQIAANEESIALKVSSQEFTSYKTTVTSSINTAKTEAINIAAEDATEKADAAQSVAISTAAADATEKTDAAQNAAISAAAKDAQTKATAAQNAAISAAAKDATEKANAAQSTAISTAAADATKKANEAKEDAISSAAEDATEKANEAKNDAITTAAADATAKADAAKNSAIATAASDATTKANNAKNAAISAAATDAAAKVAQALSDAKDYTDEEITIVSKSLSTATADISVLKNQIALKVEQTDIDAAVAEVNGKFASYSTTSQMNAAITAAKNSITSTVSQTYATKKELTTASGKISELETWKTEASQKITKDGIISTVGNYYAYESDLKDAEQRLTTAESSIIQNSSGITVALQSAETAQTAADNAAKIATNFLKFESSGLIMGDMTGDVLGNNILIDLESINFRYNDKILAKYTSDSIHLGVDDMNTTINFGGVFDIVTEPNLGDVGRAYLSHYIDNELDNDIYFTSIGVNMSSFARDDSFNYAQVDANGRFGHVRLLTRSGIDSRGTEKHADIELEAESSFIRLLTRSGIGSGGTEKRADIEIEAEDSLIKIEADTILLGNKTKITTNGIEINDGDIIMNGSSLNSKLVKQTQVTVSPNQHGMVEFRGICPDNKLINVIILNEQYELRQMSSDSRIYYRIFNPWTGNNPSSGNFTFKVIYQG